jgi:hypothetical protein
MNFIKSFLNVTLPVLITILITIIIETILYFKKINTDFSNEIKNYLATLETIKLSIPDELKNISIFTKLGPHLQTLIVNEFKKEITTSVRESINNYDKNLEDKRNQIMIAYLILLFTFGLFIVILLLFFRNYIDWVKLLIYSVFILILLIGTEIFFVKQVFPNLAIINGYEILYNIISSITSYLQK